MMATTDYGHCDDYSDNYSDKEGYDNKNEDGDKNKGVADELNSDDYENFVVEDEASGASDFDNYGENISERLVNIARSTENRTSDEGHSEDEIDSEDEYGGGPNRRRFMAEMIDNRSSTTIPPIFNDKRLPSSKIAVTDQFKTTANVRSLRPSTAHNINVPRSQNEFETQPSAGGSMNQSNELHRRRMRTSSSSMTSSTQQASTTTRSRHSSLKQEAEASSRKRRVFWVERTEFTGGDHRPCFTFHGAVVEISHQTSSAPSSPSTSVVGQSEQHQYQSQSHTQQSQDIVQTNQRLLEKGLTLSVRYEPPSPKFSHKCPSSASYRLKVARGKDFLYSTRGMDKSLFVDYNAHHAVWGDLELHFVSQAEMRRFMIRLKHVKQEDVTGKGILLGDYYMHGAADAVFKESQDIYKLIFSTTPWKSGWSSLAYNWTRYVWIKATLPFRSLAVDRNTSSSSSISINKWVLSCTEKVKKSICLDGSCSGHTSGSAIKYGVSFSVGVGVLAAVAIIFMRQR